jgi:NADPH2 dehydrogenase
MQALTSVFPSNRVGIRISPFSTFQAMREADPYPTSIAWLRKLLTQWPDLAYVHCIESRIDGSEEQESDSDRAEDSVQPFRDVVQELGGGKVKFLTAGGYDPKSAAEHSQKYPEDLIVFGRYFIGEHCAR